jgi:hypothetical protein
MITRRNVLEKAVAALGVSAAARPQTAQENTDEGDRFFERLLKSSNETVVSMLRQPPSRAGRGVGRGANLAALAAAYCAPESPLHANEQLIPLMESASAVFVAAQHPDGTLDAGNLASPPDTAFVVEVLATTLAVLRKTSDPKLERTKNTLSKFLLSAGEALITGGVHTPNHRWVVCSGLARLNSLFPDARYVARLDDWLGEGIYQDADGQFEERSAGIYSRVTVNAFVTMARLLNRPELLVPVRRNLDMTLYYLHPDGEVETVASRRQDQTMSESASNYLVQYRYLAIRDNNSAYGAVVRLLESKAGEGFVENGNPLIYFMEEPLLRKSLPEGGEIPSDYARVFAASVLARVRRGSFSATVYGGSDWPLGVASGLASNPTFFNFRKGKAVLQSVRMGGQFFSEGVFRSEGLRTDGNAYVLHQRFDVPYYQPLPKEFRNPKGDYALTPARDQRFWSKLDFPHRRMTNIQTLDQKVTVVEKQGGFELQFDITGADHVPFVVELSFRAGGEMAGSLQEASTRDNGKIWFLREGTGSYRVGEDVIEFGPGQTDHQFTNLSGPSYAAHGATLKAGGTCVYITGFTPFRKVITIRGV